MTKEEFAKKWITPVPSLACKAELECKQDLEKLIASELAKATRPKPPFEKPFETHDYIQSKYGFKGGVSDNRGTLVFEGSKAQSEYICNALNSYEGE